MTALTRRAGASTIRGVRRRVGTLACVVAAATAALGTSAYAAATGGSAAHAASASGAAVVACLPKTLVKSARLAGTPVDVSPAPGSVTANPATQVSFLGVPVTQIHDVSVTGAASGRHGGSLRAYSQGDGASFVPRRPSRPASR
jgi:hypothetical protein